MANDKWQMTNGKRLDGEGQLADGKGQTAEGSGDAKRAGSVQRFSKIDFCGRRARGGKGLGIAEGIQQFQRNSRRFSDSRG
jgi:hypothetical protein